MVRGGGMVVPTEHQGKGLHVSSFSNRPQGHTGP